jgi:hypothetical protein
MWPFSSILGDAIEFTLLVPGTTSLTTWSSTVNVGLVRSGLRIRDTGSLFRISGQNGTVETAQTDMWIHDSGKPFFDITDYEFRCQLIANTLDPLSYATGPGWVDMDLQTSFAWFVSAETDIGSGDFESTQADIELSIRQKSNPANIVTGDIRLIAVSEGGD